jgi:hypothetical protein
MSFVGLPCFIYRKCKTGGTDSVMDPTALLPYPLFRAALCENKLKKGYF